MRKKQKSQKKEINIPIMILSIILAIFAILCIIIIFANKSYNLILGTVGIVLLILTINVSNLVKITKDNEKIIPIASIILNLIAIPLLFKHVIFSYVLSIPAFILSIKCIKNNKKKTLNIACLIISVILLIACISFSIGGYIKVLNR